MKRLLFVLLWLLPAWAAATEMPRLDRAPVDLDDKASLQRGARLYADYCLGCHSLQYLRYSRMARDLELPEATVVSEFLYDTGKIGDTMQTAMTAEDGEAWFGVAPPDLSLAARARGADWLYTYLRSFYVDPTRPAGANNLVYKDVAMPNVLSGLQGLQKRVAHHIGSREVESLEVIHRGSMDGREFDRAVGDLVNFLAYAGEPAQLERSGLGKWVLLFLVVLLVVLYRLKKEYWRDVH